MRRYARDMAMLAESRRKLEPQIKAQFPNLTHSEVRSIAKRFVIVAYHTKKNNG